jgi:hypothetical protein
MWPMLIPGRRYLATSLLDPRRGRLVICANPYEAGQFLVKKIDEIAGDKLHIGGLVPWSDSYDVTRDMVWGVIVSPRLRW